LETILNPSPLKKKKGGKNVSMVTEVEYFDLVAIEQCYRDILIGIKQLWYHFGH
jgi:hypothetical protein